MDFEIAMPLAVVSLLCCGGLLKRPETLYELLAPRFVVPGVVWLTTAGNVWLRRVWDMRVVEQAYEDHADKALWFVAASLAVFWLAYLLPIGKVLGKNAPYLPLDLRSHSTIFLILCVALLVVMHVVNLMPPLPFIDWLLKILVRVGPFASALLLGLYLGAQRRLGVLGIFLMVILIVAAMWPLMGSFSRGTGLPIVIMTFSFCYMRKQMRLLPILLSLFLMAYLGVQGLQGRGVKGHYSGTAAYLEFVLESPIPKSGLASSSQLMHDALTPTTVAIQAREQPAAVTRTLSVTNWLLNAIPLPRAVGLPQYDLSLGSYIAGQPISWGFTPSVFGDVYHHLGWFGCLIFLLYGVFYHAVEEVGFRKHDLVNYSSEWYAFLVLVSYYALALSLYLTFRSWLTLTTLGVYAMVGVYFVQAFLGTPKRPPQPKTLYYQIVPRNAPNVRNDY